jgi:hypothetical protein
MLYFGRIGSSWGHRAFFGSSWGEKVITRNSYIKLSKHFSILTKYYFLLVLRITTLTNYFHEHQNCTNNQPIPFIQCPTFFLIVFLTQNAPFSQASVVSSCSPLPASFLHLLPRTHKCTPTLSLLGFFYTLPSSV